MERYAEANGIPWIRFGKGDRKIDVIRPCLETAECAGGPGCRTCATRHRPDSACGDSAAKEIMRSGQSAICLTLYGRFSGLCELAAAFRHFAAPWPCANFLQLHHNRKVMAISFLSISTL
jgi:hypothetical protein